MVIVLVAIAGLIGVGVGWALARRRAERERLVVDEPRSAITPRSSVAAHPAGTAVAPTWSEVVDRLNLGVVVAGPSGRIQYRNPAARAMAGTHLGLLVDDTIERLLATAREGTESTKVLELYGPPRVAVVVRAVPLPDGTAVASIEDVSERRRVDAVRTDFVANISHELKTPVGALAVLAEALEDEDDIEVVKRVADRMVSEAHRVGRTIDDLMELSRIELGEEPVRDPVDVGDVVLGAVQRSRTYAEQRAIAVQVLDQPEGVIVTGDRRQLESALGNLVENAVKYSEPGSSVQVRDPGRGAVGRADGRRPRHRHPGQRPRPHLRALLPGRPGPQPRHRRHRARAVDRPPRRHQPRRRRARVVPGGRGLDVRAADPAGPHGRAGPGPDGGAVPMTNPTVLVVEDEASFVEALTIGLRREGFTVEVARDGFEALERFDVVRPDLVLLDVMLPRVSGIDVCRQLRKRSQVPIIMVTAKGAEIDTVVGLEVGADDYVTKPYRLRELVARMRAVLRRSPSDGAGELGPSVVTVGEVVLDPDEHTVAVDGEPLALPLKEFELLHVLLANAGRVLPRDTLIDRVWGSDYVGDTKTLDVHVKRLRGKIEPDPSNPTRIVTIRGLGYKYERT